MADKNRAICRTQLTKLCNAADDYLRACKREGSEGSEEELTVFLHRLRNIHSKLKAADDIILRDLRAEEQESEFQTALDYDDKAVAVEAKLEFALKKMNRQQAINNVERQEHETHRESEHQEQLAAQQPVGGVGIKLKHIGLKKFDGKYENWLPFWEQFRILVHENARIDSATKFNYLSDALAGRAAASIAGYLPTESCYNAAIESLVAEYGDKEKLAEKYIQRLLNIKHVTSASDVTALRKLYNDTTATMRTLEALAISSSQYTVLVNSVLLKAKPAEMRVEFHKIKTKASVSLSLESTVDSHSNSDHLSELLEFIKIEVESLEKSKLSETERERDSKFPSRQERGTAVGLYTNNSKSKFNANANTAVNRCVFCKLYSHEAKDCKSNMKIEERKEILKKEGRCFRCTKLNHNSKFCKNQWIKCEKCGHRHLTVMCENDKINKSETPKEAHASVSSAAFSSFSSDNNVYLQTAQAILASEGDCVLSRIIMDSGSQSTYVTDALVKKLNLPIVGNEKMRIIAFGDNNKNKKFNHLKKVILKVKGQYANEIIEISASVVPKICPDVLPVPNSDNPEFSHFKDCLADKIVSKEVCLSGINLLIGQDNYWQFNTHVNERIAENIVAVKTFFGWTVQGCFGGNTEMKCVLNIIEETQEDFNVSDFWDLETVGIKTFADNEESENLKIEFRNGRYSVNLPWKLSKEDLNCNEAIALSRLNRLTAKLFKNQNKLIEYDAGIRELIESGVAERVNNCVNSSARYYMPHRPVYRDDKSTTKMRIVFDASSSETGLASLNESLSPGKNLLSDFTTILLRFRCNPVALVADIEKAFLQISINENERDTHRFYWYKETPQFNHKLPDILELRMTRVTFGVTSSPFLLSSTIQHHLETCKAEFGSVCDKLSKSFYVDDLTTSVISYQEAHSLYTDAVHIMQKAHFNLRKWNSNDLRLKRRFSSAEYEPPAHQKVLGINWDTMEDDLNVDLEGVVEYIKSLEPTKRNVLRAMARIYDPLGFLGPFTVTIKILLQKIWKFNLEWDDILPEGLANEFRRWRDDLINLKDFTIPRCLTTNNFSKVEFHIFAVASPHAFGAVAYLRVFSYDDEIKVSFICSRNRISPIKKDYSSELSLPKLELTAALIAARLKAFLVESLDLQFDSIHLWTDSSIAYSWIVGNGTKSKQHVASKINEINKLTNIYGWKHCEGKFNPADCLTRGFSAKQLLNSDLWRHGPPWLSELNGDKRFDKANTILLTEIKVSDRNIKHSDKSDPLFTIENHSRLQHMLRVTSYVFKFIERLKGSRKQMDKVELTAEDLQKAEEYWVKEEQRKYFGREVRALSDGKPISSDSKIFSLNPVIRDGILRVRSRLPDEEFDGLSNPIILPKNSHLAVLIIRATHKNLMHCGVNATLYTIRKSYWIIQGRQLIKTILQQCVICKRLQGKRLQGKCANEPWTNLPIERVATTKPFATTGLDFAGPLYITQGNSDVQHKVYVMLFTCAAVRAVHLELVEDMSVQSCINGIRRFVARRGAPNTIISDNAKTFKRADMELAKLQEFMSNPDLQDYATKEGIKWKYIPERAAWWGGFWERLVKSIKTCLKSAIGKAKLQLDEMQTLLTEVESVVNQRPLTYVSDDPNDISPLSPAHFLGDCSVLGAEDFKSDGNKIAEAWRSRSFLIKRYMKRWREEYLCKLRSIHCNKSTSSSGLKIGDVVLIKDQNQVRLLWRLGVIVATYVRRDGRVRVCDVRVKNQQILKRPIQLLCPLEVRVPAPGPKDVKNI